MFLLALASTAYLPSMQKITQKQATDLHIKFDTLEIASFNLTQIYI